MDLIKVDLTIPDYCRDCWEIFLSGLTINFDKFAQYKKDTNEFYFTEDFTDDDLNTINQWIETFTCEEVESQIYEVNTGLDVITVLKTRDPTIDESVALNTIWINKISGEIFVNIDNTPERNIWAGVKTGKIIKPLPQLNKFDFFGDGSSLLYYPFNGSLDDLGGLYKAEARGKIEFFETLYGAGVKISSGGYLLLPSDIDYGPSLAMSICFKPVKPNLYNCVAHFSQTGNNYFSLWIYRDSLKIIFADRTYTIKYMSPTDWDKVHHVVMQSDGTIYINGTLVYETGFSIDPTSIYMRPIIGADRDGASINDWYTGDVYEYRLFKNILTDTQIQELYEAEHAIYNEETI